LELDTPSVSLFYQFAFVPGIGFILPLREAVPIVEGSHVAFRPLLGFGTMGIGPISFVDGEIDSVDETNPSSNAGSLWYFSSTYAEVLFAWDFTAIAPEDPFEVALGFRLGLTHTIEQSEDDREVASSYEPTASLVFRLRGFF